MALFTCCSSRIFTNSTIKFIRPSYQFFSTFPKSSFVQNEYPKDFFLFVLGKKMPVSKNTWSEKLIADLSKQKGITMHSEPEQGFFYGLVSEAKNMIQFRGITPLEAIEDMRQGLEILQVPPTEAIHSKVDQISNQIMKFIRDN